MYIYIYRETNTRAHTYMAMDTGRDRAAERNPPSNEKIVLPSLRLMEAHMTELESCLLLLLRLDKADARQALQSLRTRAAAVRVRDQVLRGRSREPKRGRLRVGIRQVDGSNT